MLIVSALIVLTRILQVVSLDPPLTFGQHYPYTALWNGTQPELTDPRQKDILDCWFAAASIATVYVSPESIKHLFYFPNGTSMGDFPYPNPSSDNVTVTLFHPTTYQPYNFTASIMSESWSEDHPGGCWWNSALTQAALQFSAVNGTGVVPGILANGSFDNGGGSASTGMTIFTGLPSATEYAQNYASLDDFFNDLSKSPHTPVVVGTVDDSNITKTVPPLLWEWDEDGLFEESLGFDRLS
ncbi:hypothetical protein BCR39DRAFT_587491 [Naematelia encephala]|uniref:Calpain catalytic domain-containing protein n=1 Tax=Naematelia encephala TaxID=71784 RepID=A0A1Y2B952_9TREE|nr:hypothetical protein BCR39DRAFT_587491 [Naematelia encephala]